jgi:ubiquinone biosynthesis protein COQ4
MLVMLDRTRACVNRVRDGGSLGQRTAGLGGNGMTKSFTYHARTTMRFSQALVHALLDSTRTDELLVGEEISSVGRMEALVPLMRSSPSGRRILAERPVISTHTISQSTLESLPQGSLGRAYAEHLKRERLDLDALTTPVTRSPSELANYLLMRVRQTHDLWHTVLGLGASGHHEVLVHAFQWPQLRMPYSALVVGLGAIKHMALERRFDALQHGIRSAHAAGCAALPLITVYWEQHLEEPLTRIRRRLSIQPAVTWRGVTDAILT